MSDETPLDRAHARMMAPGAGETEARAYYAALSAADLTLILKSEPEPGSGQLEPEVFRTEDGALVLAFDSDARAAAFLEQPTPTARMSGADLARLLAPAGLALGLNLDVAPSAMLLPNDALVFVAEETPDLPDIRGGAISGLRPPETAGEALKTALAAALTAHAGQLEEAHLFEAALSDGAKPLVMAIVGASPEAQAPLARAVERAVALSGQGDVTLDVMFLDPEAPVLAQLRGIALSWDAPQEGPRLPGAGDQPPRLI